VTPTRADLVDALRPSAPERSRLSSPDGVAVVVRAVVDRYEALRESLPDALDGTLRAALDLVLDETTAVARL
jgi:hypothetical protein